MADRDSWRLAHAADLARRLLHRIVKGGRHEITRHSTRTVEPATTGAGPLFYRSFEVTIANAKSTAPDIMRRLQADPNLACPQALAHYRKTKGSPHALARGDEFLVEVTGPWNGPVRTIAVDARSFTLRTLSDHFETGEIGFALDTLADGRLRFTVASWARSRDVLVDWVYDKLKIAQLAQTEMWTSFCEGVVGLAGGEQVGDVEVRTERVDVTKS